MLWLSEIIIFRAADQHYSAHVQNKNAPYTLGRNAINLGFNLFNNLVYISRQAEVNTVHLLQEIYM